MLPLKVKRSEMYLRGKSVRSWCDGSSDRSFMECSTTGLTKAVVCASLYVHIEQPLLLIGKSSHVAAAVFLSRYLSGPIPYA